MGAGGAHSRQVADGRVLPHGEGQGRGIECYVLSFPGFAGSRLGCVPAPEVVEGLDLPVIPAADSVIPPVSGALGPTSSEAAAGRDTPKDKSEGAGLTAGPVGGEDERGGGPALSVQSGLPPGPRKVGGEDPPIGVCGYGGAVAGQY